MTQEQDNIRTMFQTTIAFLNTNNSVWGGTPAFADAVKRANNGLVAIGTSADSQQTPTTGLTGDKAQARAGLEEATPEIADELAALAAGNGDHDLAAKAEMTKSALD